MVKKILLAFVLLSLSVSCKNDSNSSVKPAVKGDVLDTRKVEIKNFDKDFFALPSDSIGFSTALENFKTNYSVFFYGNAPTSTWLYRRNNESFKVFADSMNQVFDEYKWEEELISAFEIYKEEFINDILPRLFVWNSGFEMNEGVWAYGNDLIIATDQYLGANHPYIAHLPMYIQNQKEMKYLTFDVLNAQIESKLISVNPQEKPTLISGMILAGKRLYTVNHLLGNKMGDDFLMKTSEKKTKWAQSNEKEIWNYFVSNELLFSTQDDLKMRFLRQAPFSKFYLSFDQESPGRIGEWIGLQIIRAYMKNTGSTLEDMLNLNDPQKILNDSKYKP